MLAEPISIILIVISIISAILSARAKEILIAAISLAVLSATIGIMCFKLNSPYAGVFEISVCAGLITVLFVSVISLTERK